jgi:hypothetical protein
MIAFVFTLMLSISMSAQVLTQRDIYDSMEVGQKQLIEKEISGNLYNYSDTAEVHQFMGWIDTTSNIDQWIGQWAIYPCKKIHRFFIQGDTTHHQDVLYYVSGNPVMELRQINNINGPYQIKRHLPVFVGEDSVETAFSSVIWPLNSNECGDTSVLVANEMDYSWSSFGVNYLYHRFGESEAVEGIGEVMYLDSVVNDQTPNWAYHQEKRNQLLFQRGNEQCVVGDIVLKDSIAQEGLCHEAIYNFAIGDEFIYRNQSGSHNGMGGWSTSTSYEYIKITDKQENSDQYIYTYDAHNWSNSDDYWSMDLQMTLPRTGCIDPAYWGQKNLHVSYDSLCELPVWDWSWNDQLGQTLYSKAEGYGIGLGKTFTYSYQMNYSQSNKLIDFRKNGIACGDWMEMSIQRDQRIEDWTVFPTLTRDEVHFVIPDNAKGVTVQVSDQFGRLLESHQAGNFNGGEINTLNFSQNPDGLYFLSLWVDGVIQGTHRVIKIQ